MKLSRVVYSFDLHLFLVILSSVYNSAGSISNGPNRYSPIQRGYPPPPPPPPVKIHYGPKPPPNQIYVNKGPNEHLHLPPQRGSIIRSHLSAPSHGPPGHVLHAPPPAQLTSSHGFPLKGPLTSHSHGLPVIHGHGINLHHGPIRHGHPSSFNIPGPPQPPPPPPPPPSPPPPPKGPHFHNQGPPREFIVHQHRPPPPTTIPPIHSHKLQFSSWKAPPNSFKAPAVKESFHASPPSTYQSTSQFIRDNDDKGPIHTIPAPDLSLSDKNQHHIQQQQHQLQKQQQQQHQLEHIKEQQHLKHIQEQHHLKHVQEQQHLNHIQEQQHLNHIQEQQHLNHIQEQQHREQIHRHHQKQHLLQQTLKLPQVSRPVHTDHTPVVTTHLKIDPLTTYKVMEDQTAHKPGEPSYFAPDPDPSIRTPKVPPTTDPFSFPSNGQLPLDLILQQHNEKQNEQLQHLSSPQHSSTMTAQDLFNIFNTINSQQQQLEVIPPSAVDQHLQNHDLFDSGLGQHHDVQHEPQNFHPQYETFNYDERTQQGAYGSDSFPVGSANYEFKRAVEKHEFSKQSHQSRPMRNNQNVIHQTMAKSNSVSFSSNHQKGPTDSGDSDTVDNQVDYDDQASPEEREIVTTRTMKNNPVYTTLPSREAAQTLAHLAASGMKSSTRNNYSKDEMEEEEEGEEDEDEGSRHSDESESNEQNREAAMHNEHSKRGEQKHSSSSSSKSSDGNVQVQKAIQIYESSYFDKPNAYQKNMRQEQEYEDEYTQDQDDDMENGETQSSRATENVSHDKAHTVSQSMSFGERITPKRN